MYSAIDMIRRCLDGMIERRFGRIVMGTVRVRWRRTQEYYDQDPWRGTWAEDGGVFANQASHHVDLLEWMLGEPEAVFAKARTALVDIEVEEARRLGLRVVLTRGSMSLSRSSSELMLARGREKKGSIKILVVPSVM